MIQKSPSRQMIKKQLASLLVPVATVFAAIGATGCKHAEPRAQTTKEAPTKVAAINAGETTKVSETKGKELARRYTYTPKPYPVDERGFSPVDKALARAYARE